MLFSPHKSKCQACVYNNPLVVTFLSAIRQTPINIQFKEPVAENKLIIIRPGSILVCPEAQNKLQF